jgi:hypothetical protein
MWIVAASSCTRHYANAVTSKPAASAPATSDTLTSANLADSLIGTWKIKQTEIPQMVDKMTTYGSQTEKDDMIQKQKQYQSEFMSLTATFRGDRTYETSYNGQSDIGTWRINRKKELEAMSGMSGSAMTFQVQSLSRGVLVAKYEGADITLLLTFIKQ